MDEVSAADVTQLHLRKAFDIKAYSKIDSHWDRIKSWLPGLQQKECINSSGLCWDSDAGLLRGWSQAWCSLPPSPTSQQMA